MTSVMEKKQPLTTGKYRESSDTIQRMSVLLLRYGLVLVVAWIGAMKFTAYEAPG